ncbi:transketolase [Lachnotalea sp. AF33-28]|uniref:transketolase n=1 Tax=Lachnotalea sp. AF33-28 TaxID=2292046 RepID=UPI000E50A4D2|nr:transketolase [Lachnotalea sp. AF33-28]RHP29096.1 transketolase [Lachnotalea sp. AF33-28]
MLEEKMRQELNERARAIRENVVRMIGVGKAGHIGGSCSMAEITAVLYFYKMRHDPKNPRMRDRDRFILSKGHAALVQYAALMECGYFDKESSIRTLKCLGSSLQGHPDMRKLPGIEANTGSLGQGVSLASGMAAGLRLNGIDAKVYVAVGDGELAEGQIWEALLSAAKFRLDNLRVIIDRNGLQATGRTEERFPIGSIEEKLRAFGLETITADGHDVGALAAAFDRADEIKGKPTAIVADTVKGKGIPFAEGEAGYHNKALTQEQYEEALSALKKGGIA